MHESFLYNCVWLPEASYSLVHFNSELGPFVRFGQFIGLLPYRMEFNNSSGRFKRFALSFWNSLWFILIQMSIFVIVFLYKEILESNYEASKLGIPVIFKTIGNIQIVTSFLTAIFIRIANLCYNQLSSALKS